MANIIIGIHGLANKPERDVLSEWWEKSIREGLSKNCGVEDADFEFVMVYWADFLYKNLQHRCANFDFDPLFIDQPYIPAAPGALKRHDDGLMDRIRARAIDLGGFIMGKIRGPLRLKKIEDRLMQDKARDLAYYYDEKRELTGRDGKKRSAKSILMGELMETIVPRMGDHLMLIAHSMGTIIAYDVLRDLGQRDQEFQVHEFVTIGSPLGITGVKKRIHSERSYASVPVRTPTVVSEKWVNYADPADVVAADAHLRGDFGPNGRGIQVEDDVVSTDYVAPDRERKPHKSYGYLRTPELSEQVRDFLLKGEPSS